MQIWNACTLIFFSFSCSIALDSLSLFALDNYLHIYSILTAESLGKFVWNVRYLNTVAIHIILGLPLDEIIYTISVVFYISAAINFQFGLCVPWVSSHFNCFFRRKLLSSDLKPISLIIVENSYLLLMSEDFHSMKTDSSIGIKCYHLRWILIILF